MLAARLRALRCDRELNLTGFGFSVRDIIHAVRQWERFNGKVCGAIGWERYVMGAEAEGLD
jgi:hypothetical protein